MEYRAVDDATRHRLTELWETPHTFWAWVSTMDHKKLGVRYIVTAFTFFLLGGVEAALLRAQLSRPENALLTRHGSWPFRGSTPSATTSTCSRGSSSTRASWRAPCPTGAGSPTRR